MTDSTTLSPRVALIGFGEAGESFARAGHWQHARGIDLLAEREALMPSCGVEPGSPEEVLGQAEIVLSLVTADQAGHAAEKYGRFLAPGALWCDMNSVAPTTKRAAAHFVEEAGAVYVDAAVMAPVNPARLAVPLLLSGPKAGAAQQMLSALGFSNIRLVGDDVGRASAIKMIRSVMVKGLEALSRECMTAAEAAGVLEEVTASLDASEKSIPWIDRFAYNRERMETHGLRRAAEMEEVARTLAALGIEPVMTKAAAALQRAAARKTEMKD